jgi:hypothetical protein
MFDSGDCLGTYRGLYRGPDAECDGLHHVYYQGYDRDGNFFKFNSYHELNITEYGMSSLWVLVTVPSRATLRSQSVDDSAGAGTGDDGVEHQCDSGEQERALDAAQSQRAKERREGAQVQKPRDEAGRHHDPSFQKTIHDRNVAASRGGGGANVNNLHGRVQMHQSLPESRAENARAATTSQASGANVHSLQGRVWLHQSSAESQVQNARAASTSNTSGANVNSLHGCVQMHQSPAESQAENTGAAGTIKASGANIQGQTTMPTDTTSTPWSLARGSVPAVTAPTVSTADRATRRAEQQKQREIDRTQQEQAAAALHTVVRYHGKLDHKLPLPLSCLLAFFDLEHTGCELGGKLEDAVIWEFGSATIRGSSAGLAILEDDQQLSVNSLTQCCKEPTEYVRGMQLKAKVTKQALATAPLLKDVVDGWLAALTSIATAGDTPTPVVLAGHGSHSVDFKLLFWSLKRAGLDPYQTLHDAGVLGVLDTTKLIRNLPQCTRELLPLTHAAVEASKRGGAAGATKGRDGSNKACYETFVSKSDQRHHGPVQWHRSRDDARANATWVTVGDGTLWAASNASSGPERSADLTRAVCAHGHG